MSASGPLPPFYRRPVGPRGNVIDERVLDAVEPLWLACWIEVRRTLGDDDRAAQLVEFVAENVSEQLARNEKVGRNLAGYFHASFVRHIRWQAFRNGRILYCGLGQDLELLQPNNKGADWASRIEARIFLDQLARTATEEVRWLLALRLLEWSWKEIAAATELTEVQARTRFHRGLKQAFDRMHHPTERHSAK